MSQFESRIIKIRHELFTMKFTNELEDITSNKLSDMVGDDRGSLLKIILASNQFKQGDLPEKKTTENSFHTYLDKISKNAYRKPWNSLKKFHQSIKLKEFSCTLTTDKKVQDELYSKLINSLNTKKIHTSKTVIYDHEQECILSIKGLEFNKDNTYKYLL